jgi:hypothetical protein
MTLEDRFREELETLPTLGPTLIGGYSIPTEAEGDPHDRIDQLEGTVLALLAAIEVLVRELDNRPGSGSIQLG